MILRAVRLLAVLLFLTTKAVAADTLSPRFVLGFWSILFTAIPLTLGTLVFLVFLHKGDEDKFEPYFGEGQLVQLLVIILVTGNVCSLAIMQVLNTSEVSAIYGGIIGYVLGRKTSRTPEKGDSKR